MRQTSAYSVERAPAPIRTTTQQKAAREITEWPSMKTCQIVAVLACLALAAEADKIAFKDCGSVTGKVVSVDITPCPKLPCEFQRGSNVSAIVIFQAAEAATAVKAVVHGIIGGIPVPFPLPDSDACKTMTPGCPLVSGTQYSYANGLNVLPSYPQIALVVKWELSDPNTKDLVCFEFPARVV